MTNSTPTLALLIPRYARYLSHLDSAHEIEQEINESLKTCGLTWSDLEQAAVSADRAFDGN